MSLQMLSRFQTLLSPHHSYAHRQPPPRLHHLSQPLQSPGPPAASATHFPLQHPTHFLPNYFNKTLPVRSLFYGPRSAAAALGYTLPRDHQLPAEIPLHGDPPHRAPFPPPQRRVPKMGGGVRETVQLLRSFNGETLEESRRRRRRRPRNRTAYPDGRTEKIKNRHRGRVLPGRPVPAPCSEAREREARKAGKRNIHGLEERGHAHPRRKPNEDVAGGGTGEDVRPEGSSDGVSHVGVGSTLARAGVAVAGVGDGGGMRDVVLGETGGGGGGRRYNVVCIRRPRRK